MSISSAQRQFIYDRAGGCCEYCRLPASGGAVTFQIDHIIPIKHGGQDDDENLCLACFPCNIHKSHDLTGFDPLTGEISRLYHPRQHQWSEHFSIADDMRIIGITPQGRTTVSVLQINITDRVENRQGLALLGDYPCMND